MPEKKKQHLVPACYLKNFIANTTEQLKENPNYESGIYVNNNTLTSGWKLRSIRHVSLTKPYFYNLPEDNPEQPMVENFLSKVEGDFSKYFKEVNEGTITNENMSFFSYFVTLQYMRVDTFINMFQGAWDKIAGFMDNFEGGDKYKTALKDITKRQLPIIDLGYLLHPHSTIIYNSTPFKFLTSDNPVVRRQINISDAVEIIPSRSLVEFENESIEFAFFFFPLSPRVAYVSCELIRPGCNAVIFSKDDLSNIFFLNYYSIVNSHEKVFSFVIEPMKAESQLSQLLMQENKTTIKIYTQTKRLISPGSIEGNAKSIVSLKIEDIEQVGFINKEDEITLVEVIENGRSIRGMRNCKVTFIDYVNGIVTIESNFQP